MQRKPFEREISENELRSIMWSDDERLAMTRLVQSFPSLQAAKGGDPWSPRPFVTWVCSSPLSPSGELAARFVLDVWASTVDWRAVAEQLGLRGDRLGGFDAVEAMRRWDEAHRAAFVAWAMTPFFGSGNAVTATL